MLRKYLALSALLLTMFSGNILAMQNSDLEETIKGIMASVEDTECKKSLNDFFDKMWAYSYPFGGKLDCRPESVRNMIQSAEQRTLSTSQAELTERLLGLKVVSLENSFVKNNGIV